MELLSNPNVAYLVLVLGFMLAILALFSPGTGVLEVVGLFMLILAGWQISQLEFNWIALAVLALGVFPFIIALRKTGKWYHFAISLVAFALGSTFLFTDRSWTPLVHPLLAVVVNALVVGFFWVVLHKGAAAILSKPANRLTDTVGSTGETRSAVHTSGTVYLKGELWSATSRKPIPENRKVRVIAREGYVLEVEELPPSGVHPKSV